MDAVTLKLFPTLVHVVKIKEWEKYKSYLLDMIKNEKSPAYRPSVDYYTDYGLDQPWRETLWDKFLEPQIRPLLDQTHTKLQDIWSQQYINQAGFTTHRHQPIGYSCVFYAQFDPKHHSATTLFRPYLDPNDQRNVNDCYTPNIEEGNLLVFPSWMLHQAIPSNSQVPRTIIAFNLEPKE